MFLLRRAIGMLTRKFRQIIASCHRIYDLVSTFLVFYELLSTGMFFIRLDGSPNYAMMCNAIAAIFNIIFDYIFIFEFGWGMMGAAFATSLGTVVGGLMTVIYLRGSPATFICIASS